MASHRRYKIRPQDHLYLAGPSLVKLWGRERAEWMTPLRTYIDRCFTRGECRSWLAAPGLSECADKTAGAFVSCVLGWILD